MKGSASSSSSLVLVLVLAKQLTNAISRLRSVCASLVESDAKSSRPPRAPDVAPRPPPPSRPPPASPPPPPERLIPIASPSMLRVCLIWDSRISKHSSGVSSAPPPDVVDMDTAAEDAPAAAPSKASRSAPFWSIPVIERDVFPPLLVVEAGDEVERQ